MHAAFLTSECGIGKTNTMLACLKIPVQRRIEAWESSPWQLDTWYDIATWKKLVQGFNTPDIDADRIYRATKDEMDEHPATPSEMQGNTILCVRRSMLSIITLPGGTITCPGKGIPALACNEVEFNLHEQVRPKLWDTTTRLHANLTTQGPRSKSFKSRHGVKVGGSAVQLNGNAMRRMVLALTNVHNIKMTSPIVRTNKLLKNVSIQKIIGHTIKNSKEHRHNIKTHALLTPSVDDFSQTLTPMQEKQREGLQRRKRPEAAGGTAEMSRVAADDSAKGLQALLWSPWSDRKPTGGLSWRLSSNPLTAGMILLMLEALGIRNLSIQSKHSQRTGQCGEEVQLRHCAHQRPGYLPPTVQFWRRLSPGLPPWHHCREPSVDFGERTRRKKYTGKQQISSPPCRLAQNGHAKDPFGGLFLHRCCSISVPEPEKQDRTTADTIGGIAARWELGSELTIAHVEPGHPDCPPGIDPETPGRVSLSSAREQEKVLEENMAMFQCEGVEEDEPDEQPEESTDVGGRKRKRTS
ncbi:hypothetical protein EDB82DRAFT_470091 [Fusarium venenatum]|uniref:uncharacterized protein n=1 Tax=Fusarium venenatum TaxID=56646 RepID=UPI001DE11062|nr:hypothetical protein EDB82DRAFT_470091 [Fusarium venenatum]